MKEINHDEVFAELVSQHDYLHLATLLCGPALGVPTPKFAPKSAHYAFRHCHKFCTITLGIFAKCAQQFCYQQLALYSYSYMNACCIPNLHTPAAYEYKCKCDGFEASSGLEKQNSCSSSIIVD